MLPSTGFFKGITCPFFESGLCERPYCHFRHVKRDLEASNAPLEDSDVLKQLVSAAVKKVLMHSETTSTDMEIKSQSIISQVVEELAPAGRIPPEKPPVKATYNPTPISELNRRMQDTDVKVDERDLNRRHIPVPYTPHRPSRTHFSRPLLKLDTGGAALLTVTVKEACAANSVNVDSKNYTPSAVESESSVKYLPGSVGDNPTPYSPMGQPNVDKGGAVSYTPSSLSAGSDAAPTVSGYLPTGQSSSGVSYNPGSVQTSSLSNSYCPSNNSTLNQNNNNKPFNYVPKFTYKPTPLVKAPSPTFSSDESDEPSAKKVKLSKTEELDDLDVEFDMLGEILDDENNSIKKSADNGSNGVLKPSTSSNNNIPEDGNTVVGNKKSDSIDNENLIKHDRKNTSVKFKKTKLDSDVKSSFKHITNHDKESRLSRNDHKQLSKAKEESQKGKDKEDSCKDRRRNKSIALDDKTSSRHKSNSSKDKSCSSKGKDSLSKDKSNSSKEKDNSSKDKNSSSKERNNASKDKNSSFREKDTLSKDKKERPEDKSSKKANEIIKKDLQVHKKNDKSKTSGHQDPKKDSDKQNKTKSSSSSSHHDSATKSEKSNNSQSRSKHISSKHESKSSKDLSSTRDKHKDKLRKSSSKHSSEDKSNSKRSSTGKSSSTHSKHTETKDLHSKNRHVKEIDLFSSHNSDDSDVVLVSDTGSIENDPSSESDEETISQECRKIFDEYVPTTKETHCIDFNKDTNEETAQAIGKKRVAHATNQTVYRTPSTATPNHKTKAVQMVSDRYAKVRQFHKERESSLPTPSQGPSSSSVLDEPSSSSMVTSSKIRIAHVPYASTLLNAKKALNIPEPPKSTPIQTVSKGSNRVAHIPNEKFSDRPTPLEPLASKVPINIRSKYLNLMIDDCLKIYLTAVDAYERALQEELITNKKCNTLTIYKNSALMTISRLRKEVKENSGNKISNGSTSISHNQVILGKKAESISWSIENKYRRDTSDIDKELKGSKFYENICKWILTEQELQDNGFPRPHPEKTEKGYAKIYTQNTRQKPQKGFTRCCNRCKKEYTVDKKGVAVRKEECIYHPNNKYRFRGEVKYQCCSQDASSDGCLSASCHVYEYVDHGNLRGFVTTLPKDYESFQPGVYALDCEMCYTTNGLDLTRVTVISSNLKVCYETFIKPLYPIIDYNTNFSGITEELMKGVTTSLLEVQATLLHMFSDKTILVGHSLESDFKALKLIHNTVVDTSVLFPHKMGPPYKRALRNLSSEYLRKIIQNSVDGHDSAEDALVCLELIIWKVKEELKFK